MGIVERIKSLFSERGWKSLLFFSSFKPSYNETDMLRGLVFACLNAIASKLGTIELYVRNKKDDEINENHAIMEILKKPHPFLTYYQFMYLNGFYLGLHGQALWWIKEGATGSRKFLVPINPYLVSIETKNDTIVYKINWNNTQKELKEEDVLHIKRPHPFNPWKGLSVLEQARLEVENDLQSIEIFKGFLERGAVPSGVLTAKTELSEDTFQRLKEQIDEQFSGKANFFKPILLENAEWKNISIPFKDLQFIEQRKFTRDQILAIFGVPKPVLFAEDVNRANSEAAKYWFAEYTIKPYLDIIIDGLETDLLEKLGYDDVYFDYESFIPEDKEYNLKRYTLLTDKVITRNEARAELGLEPVDGGDMLYFLTGIPVGSVISEEEEKSKGFKTSIERKKLYERNKVLEGKERYLKGRVELVYRDFLEKIKKHKKKATKQYRAPQEVILEFNPYFEFLEEELAIQIGKAKVRTAEKAAELFEQIYGITLNFDLEDIGAIRYLTQVAVENAHGIRNTTMKRIREIIADAMSEGKFTLEKAKRRIVEEFGEEVGWRAERIARTEIIDAYTYSDLQIIKNTEFIKKKKWITARDDRVCPICRELDGVVVGKHELFPGGYDRPGAHPNCRCDIVPVFD